MDNFLSLLQVLLPIVTSIALGMLAKKKKLLTDEHIRGIQQFVLKFCIPCVLFNSCLGAEMSSETIISMVMVLPALLLCTLWAFKARKKFLPYHNLPMVFAAHETGMLGIPLFILLFGADQAYRMGLLDMSQAFIGIPVLTLLSTNTSEGISPRKIAADVFSSPLLIMGLLGFVLGLSGAADWLDKIGVGAVIRETTSFMSQPVSAAMLFTIGYNFSMDRENRSAVFKISGIYLAVGVVLCLVMQGVLCLVPSADPMTRWAVLLYCVLPASYLAPSLGRNEKEFAVVSGVCSLLTVFTLVCFGIIASL